MTRLPIAIASLLLATCSVLPFAAQQNFTVSSSSAVVPNVTKFSGVLADLNGKPLTGITGITFSYKENQGGAPLWMETQNVEPDKNGRYVVVLSSTAAHGVPSDLFVSGKARWLGVRPEGQNENPRVLLVSVPYAMKAADAETLGGLPVSAFVLTAPPTGNAAPLPPSPPLRVQSWLRRPRHRMSPPPEARRT